MVKKSLIEKYFTSKQLADRWHMPEDNLKSIEGLCPPETISGHFCYPYYETIKFEDLYYLTKEDLLERWNGQYYLVNEACEDIYCQVIDGNIYLRFKKVIDFEYVNFTSQECLARKWSVSVDEIRKIDEFITHITFNGTVHYYDKDIDKYQESPILLLKDWKKRNLP